MSTVSLQQPNIRLPQVLPDLGTSEAWERHQRRMRTQEEVSRIRKLLKRRSVWCKLVRRGREWIAQVGDVREGVRVA